MLFLEQCLLCLPASAFYQSSAILQAPWSCFGVSVPFIVYNVMCLKLGKKERQRSTRRGTKGKSDLLTLKRSCFGCGREFGAKQARCWTESSLSYCGGPRSALISCKPKTCVVDFLLWKHGSLFPLSKCGTCVHIKITGLYSGWTKTLNL